MTKKIEANTFLSNMEEVDEALPVVQTKPKSVILPGETHAPSYRRGLKHIGGYFDAETTERVALLRARLALDNTQLLKQAIDDLYAKERAKRAFNS